MRMILNNNENKYQQKNLYLTKKSVTLIFVLTIGFLILGK